MPTKDTGITYAGINFSMFNEHDVAMDMTIGTCQHLGDPIPVDVKIINLMGFERVKLIVTNKNSKYGPEGRVEVEGLSMTYTIPTGRKHEFDLGEKDGNASEHNAQVTVTNRTWKFRFNFVL